MKLRVFFALFFLLLLALAGANLALGFLIDEAGEEMARSQKRLNEITTLSEDLVISSQWATRFARGHVSTGDAKRLRMYRDILDIMDGKMARPENYSFEYWDGVGGGLLPEPERKSEGATPLADRFLKLDITVDEYSKLNKALELFRKTTDIETAAMHVVKGEFDDGSGAFLKKGKPDPALASRLIYGENYSRLNGELSLAIAEFNETVKNRYKQILAREEKRTLELSDANTLVSSVLFALVVAAAVALHFGYARRAARLMRAVREIGGGNLSVEIPVTGRDEIGKLAQALRSMEKNLRTAFDGLEDKVRLSQQTMVELESERQRSEKLLNNILPAAIAERLRDGEEMIAEVFPEVTVFFSDIVGFTDVSAQIGPHATVNMLNDLFGKFDELVEKHGVEKIKTIGDSYMVVGGVPTRDPLHCQHIAEFALEAINYVREFSASFPFPIRMRMGMHTGTVAAGVLGKKKFSYDLWGDVVNIASRFESTSHPDRIHVSQAVRVRLADDFDFIDAGTVELKGKGSVASFYLAGHKRLGTAAQDFVAR